MRGVSLYVEGGGVSARGGRAALRRGFDELLGEIKSRTRTKDLRWKLVSCGPRDEAYKQFVNAAMAGDDEFVVLLVDSEGEVTGGPRAHLRTRRGDRWTGLHHVLEDQVHLMVQTMETWLIADIETLRSYYGRKFNANALPKHPNLEQAPKKAVSSGLARATKGTQKGEYHKIRHASALLARIDPGKVRERCPHCDRLFKALTSAIEAA